MQLHNSWAVAYSELHIKCKSSVSNVTIVGKKFVLWLGSCMLGDDAGKSEPSLKPCLCNTN